MIAALPVPPLPVDTPVSEVRHQRVETGRRRDILEGFAYHLELDEGRVVAHMNRGTEEAYIDAHWPHNGNALALILRKIDFWGYMPIPEDETPAEIRPNGMTRIYLMEK